MEGSLGSSGDRANLISPELLPAPEACFTFWYNMYGYNMGNLSLFTKVAFLCRLLFFFFSFAREHYSLCYYVDICLTGSLR